MHGRDRLMALVEGRPTNRLSWATLVDEATLAALPPPLQVMDCFDFYRYVRCDVMQLGGWGTRHTLQGCQTVMPGVEVTVSAGASGEAIVESRCRMGTLRGRVSHSGHPVEYPVKTIEDLRTYVKRWETSFCEKIDEQEQFDEMEVRVGENGITTLFMPPSAIPHLLEEAMGMEQFYYFLADYPDEMDALIKTIQEKELSRFELCASGPWNVLILTENTSTRYISPQIYEKYNLLSQQAFVEAAHRCGKTAILHMCGHVKDLLPLIKETEADGIHALSPPPTGDTPWELALDTLGEDIIIIGALTTDVFQTNPVSEIGPALDRLISPRLRESRFILHPFADGIPTPIERFFAVRDWVERTATSGL